MASKSKRYGSGFEYEMRDVLREATGDASFERSPGSGAFVGGKNSFRVETLREDATDIMAGDLITPQKWRWVPECKNHEDVPYHQLFIGDQCRTMDEFIFQVMDAARLTGKEPLLMVKLRKKPQKLSKKIRDLLAAAGVAAPRAQSVTVGTLVGELYEHSEDIAHLNHIVYASTIQEDGEDPVTTRWRFFDIEQWKLSVRDRQWGK